MRVEPTRSSAHRLLALQVSVLYQILRHSSQPLPGLQCSISGISGPVDNRNVLG